MYHLMQRCVIRSGVTHPVTASQAPEPYCNYVVAYVLHFMPWDCSEILEHVMSCNVNPIGSLAERIWAVLSLHTQSHICQCWSPGVHAC